MGKDAAGELRDELGVEVPPGIAALSNHERDDLADALRAARRRQATQLRAALDGALHLIPRLLRGPVRKIFGA
jgi:hypothetical protein